MAASDYRDLRQGSAVEAALDRGDRTQIAHGAGCGRKVTMILIDTALQARESEGKPVRVGMIGAGFMARGLTNQIVNSVPGMRVVAVYNRNLPRAVDAFRYAGLEPVVAETQKALDEQIAAGRPVATEDAMLLARS